MKAIPIGLQLFSVSGECKKGLPEALKAVAGIGYRGVEPFGYHGDRLDWMGHPCRDIRRMLDDSGLACCGLHLFTEALQGANLPRTIEFTSALGNRFLIVAADVERAASVAGIHELADILNGAAERLAPQGLSVGYHAHGFDFVKFDGQVGWDILFSRLRPEVIMQLDIGNCASGGGDPIATLKKFPGRARSVHLKDYGGPPGSALGDGKADWPEIFRLCEQTQGTEWYVVEEGSRGGLGFDIPRRSLEALRRMGK